MLWFQEITEKFMEKLHSPELKFSEFEVVRFNAKQWNIKLYTNSEKWL